MKRQTKIRTAAREATALTGRGELMKRRLLMMVMMLGLGLGFVLASAGDAAAQTSGCATPNFAAAQNFGAGTGPFSVTTGDFNADGKPDLATANRSSNNVSVLLGDGLGGFAAATSVGVGGVPVSVTTGDFNADGKLDLATANRSSNNVSVLLNDCTPTPANTAPVAVDDTYNGVEDTTLNVAAPGVLGNDTDGENNPLTGTIVTNAANGSVTLNSDGSFTYTPNANFFGADSFTYKANDGQADSNTATVSITVQETDADGDGVLDASDNCPTTPNADQLNTDGDTEGNACDADDDNDNVPDAQDAFPLDPNESVDTDNDGIGNNADTDDDGDNQTDADEIACGSNPLDATSKSADNDADNSPDCVDTDDDNDGVSDTNDAFPFNPNESVDTDGDGIGNNADTDDAGDGFSDTTETAAGSNPLNAASTPEVCDGLDNDLNEGVDEGFANTDGDSMTNCVDPDDDNDGVLDAVDNCPLVANPNQADFDLDGIGDTCDPQTGPPVNKDQCKNGGWMRFDFPRTFRNQGDCIQFVNTGR